MSNKDRILELDEGFANRLRHVGVPSYVFSQKSINLDSAACLIEGTTASGKPKTMSRNQQIEGVMNFASTILKGSPIFCISSTGTDTRAKYVAACLMAQAARRFDKDKYTTNRVNPMWHLLTGSYQDELRDRAYHNKKAKKPALIVLTNITVDSSEVKMEKLRDLLELYSDIPRIVTLTGMDPITFFNTKLRYPLNGALYLAKADKSVHTRGRVPQKPKEGTAKIVTKGAKTHEL